MLGHTQPLAAETVALAAALGRTLAADVTASDPLPPFPASMMVHNPAFSWFLCGITNAMSLTCRSH